MKMWRKTVPGCNKKVQKMWIKVQNVDKKSTGCNTVVQDPTRK